MKTKPILIILTYLVSFSNLYAQIETGSFDFENQTRQYGVFLPKNYDDTDSFPLVIYLHSYGWTPEQGMNYTGLNSIADKFNFIIAYPYAKPNWNSGIEENSKWPTPQNNDVGFIDAMIDTLSSNYNINLDRIYACGFSNGGFMAYKLACVLGHRFAAIASVGGVISNNTMAVCDTLSTMPILHIHGTKDSFVPIEGKDGWKTIDKTLNYWVNINNCVQIDTTNIPDINNMDGCTVEKISFTSCSDNNNIIFYKIINGGHSWPGATKDLKWAAPRNMDINAGVVIWDFFKDYKNNL